MDHQPGETSHLLRENALPLHTEAWRNKDSHKTKSIPVIVTVLFFFCLLLYVCVPSSSFFQHQTDTGKEKIYSQSITNPVFQQHTDTEKDEIHFQSFTVDSTIALGLEISNEYPTIRSHDLYPWKYLVEPYRVSTLRVDSPQEGAVYKWTITLEPSLTPLEFTVENEQGSVVSAIFTDAGFFYGVKVEEIGGANRSFESQVICKYVRREIRDLTQSDKEEFFDALKTFHTISLDEGRELYGPRFITHKELTLLHIWVPTGWGQAGCTVWHGNYGSFIYSHQAFALWMEQTLQLIHPRVSMPFWDYIQDSVNYGADFSIKSEVFTQEYFGGYQPYPYTVKGYWADLPLSTVSDPSDLASMHNDYGILTTPYNTNPSRVLQRSNEICGWRIRRNLLAGCKEVHDMLEAFSLESTYDKAVHEIHSGYLHKILGGAWDCAEDYGEIMEEYDPNTPTGALVHPILEYGLYRAQEIWASMDVGFNAYTAHNRTCNDPETHKDCRYQCKFFDSIEDIDLLNDKDLDDYANSVGLWSWFSDYTVTSDDDITMFKGIDAPTNRKIKIHLLKLACLVGSMSPAFSPLAGTDDPTFMLVHTNYQKFWNYNLLSKPDFSLYWPTNTTCYGNRPWDELPQAWYGFLGEDQQADGPNVYTYLDLMDIFEPTNPRLPYVIENFNFDYCATDDISDEDVKPDMKVVENLN
mmetsp:Transcript_25034/g.31236  ORF Transcript_25034/g.31236 Transcript_25034/m.31236 type:complete len:694 (-) Transcript_25034:300-2381(-)